VTTTGGTGSVPVEVSVPALTGLHLGDAINTLGGAGLKPHEQPQISEDVPAGWTGRPGAVGDIGGA